MFVNQFIDDDKKMHDDRMNKTIENENKFFDKFNKLFSKSFDIKDYVIDDDDESTLGMLSMEARKMLEDIHECCIEDDQDLFQVCYDNLNEDVVHTVLSIEELRTKLRRKQLKEKKN